MSITRYLARTTWLEWWPHTQLDQGWWPRRSHSTQGVTLEGWGKVVGGRRKPPSHKREVASCGGENKNYGEKSPNCETSSCGGYRKSSPRAWANPTLSNLVSKKGHWLWESWTQVFLSWECLYRYDKEVGLCFQNDQWSRVEDKGSFSIRIWIYSRRS